MRHMGPAKTVRCLSSDTLVHHLAFDRATVEAVFVLSATSPKETLSAGEIRVANENQTIEHLRAKETTLQILE